MMQQQEQEYNREEEYLAAQRAGVEALHVGRATLSQAQTQAEQLDRASNIADETDYKLQKAARVLRGMTWSGWVANAFSKSVGPPPQGTSGGNHRHEPPDVYENLPPTCQRTAQHIQNYHANVKVLEACETEEQKATCRIICDDMFKQAMQSLEDLHEKERGVEAYALQFAKDVAILRNRQQASQKRIRGLEVPTVAVAGATDAKKELMSSSAPASAPAPPVQNLIQQQQEQHLDFLSQSLGELGSIAQTLQSSMAHQNETLGQLDSKSDNVLEQQQMVNRRTERLIQKKSWTPIKPTFHAQVSIRHVATGMYLATSDKGDLFLTPQFHHETNVFGLWKRQGTIFGLKNELTRKWVGQNLFGSLACTATSFGRREEWEASLEDWTSTKLICASAGWGNGGYLLVKRKNYAVILGGSSVQDREHAAVWCIQELSGDED